MNLTNKVAIVTGGGQGIGEGICEILAKNGCTVIVTDLNSNSAKNVANKINSMNYKSISHQLDVTKHEESSLISQKVFDQFGKIDILINNAGIVAAPNWESKQKLTEDDWNLTFYENCSMPKMDSLQWIKEGKNKFIRFRLDDKHYGGCSTDRRARHSAPYWERAEVKQTNRIYVAFLAMHMGFNFSL